jgi:porin
VDTRSRLFVVRCVGALAAALAQTTTMHAQAPTATGAPARDSSLLERGELTGNWGGQRTKWKDKGFEVVSSLSQFYQGVASGGLDTTSSEYNGSAQLELKFDLDKLARWKFWSADAKAELRFGGPLAQGVGSISPVNTAVLIPASDGTAFAVTSLNVTKLIPVDLKKGELLALTLGRINLLDLTQEDFFAGAGIERFFNFAQIAPLTVLREVPLITNAVSLAYIHGEAVLATLAVMDPNDHSLDPGLSDLFTDGVTVTPSVSFPVKYFGKSANHTIGGAITTKALTPFDAIRDLILPGPPLNPATPRRGSWAVSYTFRQYIVERGKHDGWGFFTQLSTANRSTSPITAFVDLGVGGNGLFSKRTGDEFGLAYSYTDLSRDLKDNLDLRPFLNRRLRAEHLVEGFYNLHLTPWFQLTGDLQIIRPNRPIAGTAVVPGTRLRIVF